jgi:hypothetical protein
MGTVRATGDGQAILPDEVTVAGAWPNSRSAAMLRNC